MMPISIRTGFVIMMGLSLLASLTGGDDKAPTPKPAAHKVSAQGRLEPDGGVIRLAAPYAFSSPQIVAQLHVKTGDTLTKGQIVATLDSHDRLQAEVTSAEAQVKLAEGRRNLAETHFRAGEIEAAEAGTARVKAELDYAEHELKRNAGLMQRSAVAEADLEKWRMEVATKHSLLEQMKHTQQSLQEVLAAELRAAAAAVEFAQAEVRRAEAELAYGSVRAPQDGRVLKTLVRAGEQASGPVLEMGDTRSMFAVAEVYETDVRFVKPGAKAVITSPSLSQPLTGKVTSIALRVAKRDAFNVDPATRTDGRVIDVKIRLDDSGPAAGLSHLEVEVVIDADK
jgi:HlyD family secretion protein